MACKPDAVAPEPTVADALRMRLALQKFDKADATQRYYQEKADRLCSLLGALPLRTFGHDDVIRYCEQRQAQADTRGKRPVRAPTLRKEVSLLKSALNLAMKRGLELTDPERYWPQIRARYVPRKRYLKRQDYGNLSRELRKTFKREWLLWSVYTGARLAECRRLRWEDVDLVGKLLHIRGTKTEAADRIVPLHDRLVRWCEKQQTRAGPILRPWSNVRRDLHEACARAKIGPLSHNDLRRTFAAWLKQKGVDSQVVARLMGHTDSKMVDRVYGQLDQATYRSAVNKL